MIGKILKKDDIVIYESTVYPGATDDLFVPTDEANMNYVILMQMVADGDLTIADAD